MSYFFSSESVTSGHPDKICDQISDAILDEALRQDPNSRVAVEVAVKTGMVLVFGEMRTQAWVDVENIARQVIKKIGYTRAKYGFDYETVAVLSAIGKQSEEIAQGVDESEEREMGAGDQGMMFGYACSETEEFMPLPISLAQKLCARLEAVRENEICSFLRPDGKSQVTVEYHNDSSVKRVDTVVLSAQHNPEISQKDLHKELKKHVIMPVLEKYIDEQTRFFINPTGSFVTGGPQGDAGLTGRKIIVDTYGGMCPHGGGAFSGKDASKVDRSAAYLARHIAKNLVGANLAKKVLVQISYAIGVAEPISILVDSQGSSPLSNEKLTEIVRQNWQCKPKNIIDSFDLQRPIFSQTASHGHFGHAHYPWEKLDKVEKLKKYL